MKKTSLLTFLILHICLLTACGKTAAIQETVTLQPGDKLGEMTIDRSRNPCPHINNLCSYEELESGTCVLPAASQEVAISRGFLRESPSALEDAWSNAHWALEVDGHVVDLPAFGYQLWDNISPAERFWDVILVNPSVGGHSITWCYDIEDQCVREEWRFTVRNQLASLPVQ